MKIFDLLALQSDQFNKMGRSHDGRKFGERIAAHMRDFGEGAAVFIGDRLVWFGDRDAARNEARMIVGSGHAKREVVRVKCIKV